MTSPALSQPRPVATCPPDRRIGTFAQVWRPAVGDVLVGVVVDADAGALALVGNLDRALAVQPDEGRRVFVLRNAWITLHAELQRVGLRDGDRVRIVRLEDVAGRRVFRVERLGNEDAQP